MPLYNIGLFVVIKMVRNNIRTTSRGANGNWAIQNMFLAIEAYNSNACSKNQAAVNFGVLEATLRHQ